MSVTLYSNGLTITDTQAARLDDYAVAVWLPVYINEHGAEPPGWPDPAGHLALAEWAVVEAMVEQVLRFEKRAARRAAIIDPW